MATVEAHVSIGDGETGRVSQVASAIIAGRTARFHAPQSAFAI